MSVWIVSQSGWDYSEVLAVCASVELAWWYVMGVEYAAAGWENDTVDIAEHHVLGTAAGLRSETTA